MTIDLKDKPFGILIAKYKVGKTTNGMYIWRCICECGNIVDVTIGNLRSGITKSCGCLARNNATKHGHSKNNKMTSTYRSWYSMKDRCYNKNNVRHNNYAEKDIKVCDRWLDSFENFLDDMGECPLGYSLDRRKNDKGYNKENCRWATKIEQANNKSNNKFLTYKGKTQTQAQWARELGISANTFWNRLHNSNMSEDNIFSCKLKNVKDKIIKHRKRDRLISIWSGMWKRTMSLDNPSYGGRGIKVCYEWQNKNNFKSWALKNGYQEHLSLDRKDVNGDYEPSNCRWVTSKEQYENKRSSKFLIYNGKFLHLSKIAELLKISPGALSNRLKKYKDFDKIFHVGKLKLNHDGTGINVYTFKGKTATLIQWSKIVGIDVKRLRQRLKRDNWSIEKTLTTPVKNNKCKDQIKNDNE